MTASFVRNDRATAWTLAMFSAVAAASLSPVWAHLDAGWPFSHEGPAFAQRTLIYARHAAHGDVLPLWSAVDNGGFGSPMPLMYHKLFYLLAGPILLLTGSMDTALLTVLFVLLVAGAFGMRLLLEALGASRLAAAVGGCSLIVANYTVTNWMVRGNVAEASAALLVPWVLLAWVRSIAARRMTIGLGVSIGLIWLGHSVLAYFVVWLLAVSFVVMALLGKAPWAMLDPRTAWRAVGVAALFVLPYAIPMALIQRDYEFTRILTPPFRPEDQFRPLLWYFWDTHWQWGGTVAGLTLQLDLAMVVLAAISIAVMIWKRTAGTSTPPPTWLPVALPLFFALLLQSAWTAPVYHWIPGALFIQFPWRLLAIITPALIAYALTIADRALAGDVRIFSLGAVAAWMIAGSGVFVPIQDPRLPLAQVTLAGASFSGFREYEPSQAPPRAQLVTAIQDHWTAAQCVIERIDRPEDESGAIAWRTHCARPTTLPLPIYASPLHRVRTDRFERAGRCENVPDVPTVCGVTVAGGDTLVTVKLPSFGTLLR